MKRFVLLAALFVAPSTLFAAGEAVTLYKSAGCRCCDAYADYLRAHDFQVEVIDDRDMSTIKTERDVPQALESCHTSIIGGYVFEGHIPVDSVRQVLEERPDIEGISVAGMPMGTPGMGMERGIGLEQPLRVHDLDGNLYATYLRIPR